MRIYPAEIDSNYSEFERLFVDEDEDEVVINLSIIYYQRMIID